MTAKQRNAVNLIDSVIAEARVTRKMHNEAVGALNYLEEQLDAIASVHDIAEAKG